MNNKIIAFSKKVFWFVVSPFKTQINAWLDERLIESLTKDAPKNNGFNVILDTILRNELTCFNNMNTFYSGTNTIFSNKKWFLGISQKVAYELRPLFDVVGVQPLSRPVGMLFAMQTRKSENGTTIGLEVVSTAVQAATMKLAATLNTDECQDLSAMKKSDLLAGFETAIVSEIAKEITENILTSLQNIAKQNPPYDNLTKIPDLSHALLFSLGKASHDIARSSGRGPGSIIVTNVAGLQKLRQMTFFIPAPATSGPSHPLAYAGCVSSEGKDTTPLFRVYVTSIPSFNKEGEVEFLLGYRGTSAIDCGFFYAPYMFVLTAGLVVDPETFQPKLQLITRFGTHTTPNAREFYRIVRAPEAVQTLLEQAG